MWEIEIVVCPGQATEFLVIFGNHYILEPLAKRFIKRAKFEKQ